VIALLGSFVIVDRHGAEAMRSSLRLNFSLRALLGFVAVAAIGCGGLMYPSRASASLAWTLTLIALFVAVLGAVGRKGSKRAFWLGFAIAGWGYFWCAHWVDEERTLMGLWELQTHGPLLTTKFLRWLLETTHPLPPRPGGGFFSLAVEIPHVALAQDLGQLGPVHSEGFTTNFMRVGHCLWTLLFAVLGGCLTRWFHRTAEG
jgi:hypothetical protein